MNHDQMRGYLAAFIDGEGHINYSLTSRGRPTKAIAFTNTDKQLFDRVVNIAADLGLPFRTYFRKRQKPHWSDTWVAYLAGGREQIERFREIIPLQCERKLATLDEMINSYRGPEELEKIYAARRTSVTVQCLYCGKAMSAFPADVKRGHARYCSHKCWSNARIKRIAKVCETCKETYFVVPSRDKRTRFCSSRCFGLSQAERVRLQASYAARKRWGD